MILDIFLSAITNSSCGFIAAAEAVSCCIFHPLINGVTHLKEVLMLLNREQSTGDLK